MDYKTMRDIGDILGDSIVQDFVQYYDHKNTTIEYRMEIAQKILDIAKNEGRVTHHISVDDLAEYLL